jgi:CspA family cold shock protein
MEHTGIVKWFNERRGYGFIEQIQGPDVFVHHSAIQMDGYRTLAPGTEVEFEVEDSPEGPQARRVSLIDVGV